MSKSLRVHSCSSSSSIKSLTWWLEWLEEAAVTVALLRSRWQVSNLKWGEQRPSSLISLFLLLLLLLEWHPVIINVKALLLSADASRDTRKENPATQPLFSKPCALLLLYKSFFCYYHYFGGGVYIFPTSSGSMFPSFSFRGTQYLTLREANSYFSYKFFKWLLRCVPKLSWVRWRFVRLGKVLVNSLT